MRRHRETRLVQGTSTTRPCRLPPTDCRYVVIGRVVEGGDALAAIAALPVVAVPGQGEGMAASREKACAYGGADSFCAQGKPLRKLQLARAKLL